MMVIPQKISRLEKLCEPVLSLVCNYWQLAGLGTEIDKARFRRELEDALLHAKEASKAESALEHEYSRIERPLVFFVDYVVKEGKFPFKHEWRELARKYNELSGDQKFFELLGSDLDAPEESGTIILYDIMLGLGFSGDKKSDPGYVENCMKRCAAKIGETFDVSSEPLIPADGQARSSEKEKPRTPRPLLVAIVLSAVVAFICFAINFGSFLDITERFRGILAETAENAVPQSAGILYDTPVPH
ncbi:MAG: DotU family type IV/VI secretion system protein [Spirochaetaceae bacterium]|jgi:type VI protein secretion system component VasF|nr:DotU family type IV/VI secretion system protein [Spirochaetaceae bacterium]